MTNNEFIKRFVTSQSIDNDIKLIEMLKKESYNEAITDVCNEFDKHIKLKKDDILKLKK